VKDSARSNWTNMTREEEDKRYRVKQNPKLSFESKPRKTLLDKLVSNVFGKEKTALYQRYP